MGLNPSLPGKRRTLYWLGQWARSQTQTSEFPNNSPQPYRKMLIVSHNLFKRPTCRLEFRIRWLYPLQRDKTHHHYKSFPGNEIWMYLLWPRKGSLMKTQTRISDNRLYYTRKIELHRKSKKSRTVRITPIVICGIWCTPHLTGMYGTRPFFGWDRAQGRSPHAPGVCQKYPRPLRHSPC